MLVGAVGEDFADYRSWLERHDVDCDSVHISETRHTARFVCTTDTTMAQFASFYPGAMSEARMIELAPIVDRVGEPDYVLIGADDPDGMLRHTEECRQRGYRFIADPSQQLAFGEGDLIRPLIDGAAILFSNEYESAMISQKTGWTADEVLDAGRHLGHHARQGRRPDRRAGEEPIELPGRPETSTTVEPTGVGDAFRAGFLAALTWGARPRAGRRRSAACSRPTSWRRSAPRSTPSRPRSSWPGSRTTYGAEAVADVAPHLRGARERIGAPA